MLAFIKNRGFIKKVINNIRQDNLVEGYNSIIPVAIAIRYFGSGRTTYDGFTSRGAINPANILCLLDMASETVGINTVSSAVGDIYNVLTVIE